MVGARVQADGGPPPPTGGSSPARVGRRIPLVVAAGGAGVLLLVAVLVAVLVAANADGPKAVAGSPSAPGSPPPPGSSPSVPSVRASSAPSPVVTCAGPDCALPARFATAAGWLGRRPGRIGLVVRDRTTGAVLRGGELDTRYWAGSTPKLAMAVDLLERERTGAIALDAVASRQIAAMLSVSDNRAADALWDRFGGSAAWMARFREAYGLSSAGYVAGFPRRWGFITCTVEDLVRLMSYVLDTLNQRDRSYIVDAMRTVGPVQRWGVWGAGPALMPGVKNGWSIEKDDGGDIWITATVGFAGPGERYVVAAMYHQPPGGGTLERGVHGLTDLVAMLFGAPVPAPAVVPTDS